jgi:putative metallohydrolase (TIGR04338 family)
MMAGCDMIQERATNEDLTVALLLQDRQTVRLYWASADVGRYATRFHSLEQAKIYVGQILSSRWWQERYPDVTQVYVEATTLPSWCAGRAHPSERRIELNREGGLQDLVILHELTHLVVPRGEHGPMFARTNVNLVRHFAGDKVANSLERAFMKQRVRVAPAIHRKSHGASGRS